nr:E3 ubiquitin-protein ligase BRE1 [Cryptomonas sp.]
MIPSFVKEKVSKKMNSHYFLYLCIRFSSFFLDKFSLSKSISKKFRKNQIYQRYCYITIQYLVSILFNLKFFSSKLMKNFISVIFSIQLDKKYCIKRQFVRNLIDCLGKNNRIRTLYYIFFKKQKISNVIRYKPSLLFSSIFLSKLEKKMLYFQKIKSYIKLTSLLEYSQMFKILNQYKLVYSIEKNFVVLKFGSIRKEKNYKFFFSKNVIHQKITRKIASLKILYTERLNKLKSFYFFKKFNTKKLNLEKINVNIYSFNSNRNKVQSFCKPIVNKRSISNHFYKSFLHNNSNISLKIMNKVKKKSEGKFYYLMNNVDFRPFLFILILYYYFYNKYFFLIKNENRYFYFLQKKIPNIYIDKDNINYLNVVSLVKNNSFKERLIYTKKKNRVINWNVEKKISYYKNKQIENFDLHKFLKLNINIVSIIQLFSNKMTENLLEKVNINNTCFEMIRLFILKLVSFERILAYNITVAENVKLPQIIETKKDFIQHRNLLYNKIVNLEKILKKTKQKLRCGTNKVKNHMIIHLYRKLNCPIMKSLPKEVMLYRCGHLFSSKCIKNLIASRNRKCPICGKKFGTEDVKQVFLF